MKPIVCALAAAAGLFLPHVAVSETTAGSRILSPSELDTVVAGAIALAGVDAAASGAIASTEADSNAHVGFVEGAHPSIYSATAASAGTAGTVAAGDGASQSRSVVTATDAEGSYTRTTSFGWTVQGRTIGVSGGASHSVGINGAWLLGGP